jgi:hypothetical protein
VHARSLLCSLLTLLLASTALANDGAPPRNFQLTVDGPDVVVSVELTNNGEPRDVDLIRGGDTLTRIEFDADTAVETTLYCRDWGFETDCDATPDECSDCDGDGVNECPDPACDVWGVFEYVDACVPAPDAGTFDWTYTISEDYFTENLDVTVTQVDPCQPEIDAEGEPIIDNDDDSGAVTSCSVGSQPLAEPVALGLLMAGIGLFGLLAGRRRD